MIQLQAVTKTFPGSNDPAVSQINLHIGKGEFVFLVGASGTGKTTLIRLLFRDARPTSGAIHYEGQDIAKFRPRQLRDYRRQIGIVFSDFRLIERKTAFENVAFAMQVVGKSPAEIKRKVPEVLDQVGLAHKYDAFPSQLSGGEKQRVGIARAIVRDPQIILADEPTGNVDPETALDIMKIFNRINQYGTTLIIATHAWDMVNKMDKRVVALEAGCVVSDSMKKGYSRAT